MHLLDIRFLGCSSPHEHEVHYFCFTSKTSFSVLSLSFVLRFILLHRPVHLLYLYNIRHLNSR